MDIDERPLMNEESRCDAEFRCRSCGAVISGFAALDPMEMDGDYFCDACMSNYTALRIDGFLDKVSDKTKRL